MESKVCQINVVQFISHVLQQKRKEKITLVFSCMHDCEPVSLILITGSVMQCVVLCLMFSNINHLDSQKKEDR